MNKTMIGTAVAVLVLSTVICVSSLGFESDDADVSGNFAVGDKGFDSFTDAIQEAKSSELKTVKVIADNLTFKEIPNTDYGYDVSGVTIDLNGMTVTAEYRGLALAGTDFTVRNGTINVPEKVNYAIYLEVQSNNNPSENVTLEDLTLSAGVNIWVTQNVTINGLSFTGKDYYSVWCDTYGGAIIQSGVYSTVGGRSVLGGVGPDDGYYATMNIEGGTFKVGEDQVLK